MPSNTTARTLAVVRSVLVVIGVVVAAQSVHSLATMPPPPPESDGFVRGLALFFGTVKIVFALGLAAVGVALPTLLGADDPLGFGRWQRHALKGAVLVIAAGFVLGLAYGSVTEMQFGAFLWLFSIAVAVFTVAATMAWRLAAVVVRTVYRTLGAKD